MRFQEIVKTGGNSNRNNDMSNNNGNNLENNYYSTTSTLHPTGVTKTVNHKFKIPVKQLTTRQNDSLVEPQLERIPIILNLPSSQEEFGKPFLSFMKRIERHNGLKNIQLNAIEYANDDNEYNDSSLSISVDQRGWKVAIKWNIPLTKATIAEENNNEKKGEEQDSAIVHEKRQEDQAYARSHKGSNYDHNENINGSSNNNNYGNSPMIITPMEYNKGKSRYEFEDDPLEDSSMNSTGMIYGDTPKPSKLSREIHQDSEEENDPLEDISRLVENAEKESQVTHSIRVRPKDWKVCSKLYAGFDSVILAIVHDQCCVLHCSLDRGDEPSQVTQEGDSVSSVQRREKGQIIYYMLKSQSLLES